MHAKQAARPGGYRVLDVGCGDRRYEPLFTANGATYIGYDGDWNPLADLHGSIDALPVEDGSFDLVICTQVLEHLPDPVAAVRELRRAVRAGGYVLASTHGTAAYHPNPVDLWRWTHTGLETLFRGSADWLTVVVKPGQGTAATIAMVNAQFVHLLLKRLRLPLAARPIVSLLNWTGEALDRTIPILREPIPGSLHATYHIEAAA